MENSFFIYTDKDNSLEIERFHICSWEFNNNSSLVEFGFEVSKESLNKNSITIFLFIPWVEKSCETKDFYDRLSIPENSRFIFNDSVTSTDSLDGGRNKSGVIHKFSGRNELCILPSTIKINDDKIISVTLNFQPYQESESRPNIYFRFSIKPTVPYISMRKKGISKSTIIYDTKINERRNIPDDKVAYFIDKSLCKIKNCFCFNIIPNKYDIVFFDNSSLKNVRTLEYESFNKYLGDKRVKKDELLVVFNKKQNAESFSFFSIYSMERIGPGQFALAILINIVCGILLFVPAYRKSFSPELSFFQVWSKLPFEIILALLIALATLLYFVWPTFQSFLKKLKTWIANKLNPKK
jgi:hypothetical protein